MKKQRKIKKILLMLILLTFSQAYSQNFIVKGNVVDSNNIPVTGRTVKIIGFNNAYLDSVTSDMSGNFTHIISGGGLVNGFKSWYILDNCLDTTVFDNQLFSGDSTSINIQDMCPAAVSNDYIVKGNVVDSNNIPVTGRTVKIVGYNNSYLDSVVSDVSGNFIHVIPGGGTLNGYKIWYVLNNCLDTTKFDNNALNADSVSINIQDMCPATSSNDYKVIGNIVDSNNIPVAGRTVKIVGYNNSYLDSVVSDVSGNFIHIIPGGGTVNGYKSWYIVDNCLDTTVFDNSIYDSTSVNIQDRCGSAPPPIIMGGNSIITPNGDGIDDYYTLSCSGVQVFDRNGNLVRTLSFYETTWDGRDNNGNLVPIGAYTLVCSSNNSQIDFVTVIR